MTLQYVSLFSGAGGLDIGLERAGLVATALCEIDATFCSSLLENKGWRHCDGYTYFDHAHIYNADLRELDPRDVHSSGELDLIVGGPPCQSFSSSGKQLSVLDPRGALVNEFCRFVDALKPKMFLFENVRGLVTARDANGEPGGVISKLLHQLHDSGYSCRAQLLNSADYGSYQRRVRCFIVGTRNGEAPFFPGPTHFKNAGLLGVPWRTLKDFLQEYADADTSNFTYPTPTLAEQLKHIKPGSGLKSPGVAESTRPGGHWGYRQGTFVADLSLPARTVTGSASQDWVRWEGTLRRLTFNEVKQLQGFPIDWIVSGRKAAQYKQIGNAVPTMFGEALGRMIVAHLNDFPDAPPIRLELPDKFKGYIEYTKKDHARNMASRSIHKHFTKAG